jgi:hypothetical protein
MAILILTSTSGSPGVTTLAVGLALAWPRSVLLADCDPGAHQSVLAGYLGGQSPNGKGLIRVAEAHRDGRPLRDVVIDQTLTLTSESGPSRLFLPGFAKPGSANLFGGVWRDLSEAFDRLDDAGIDVLVDAGRNTGQRLPTPLLEGAALTCLVLRSNLRSVMSARVHAGSLQEQAQLSGAESPLGLIVVGEGQPYGRDEIAKALGIPTVATVALDPAAALHLSDGAPRPRKFEVSSFAKSVQTTAGTLSAQLRRTVERIRS